MNPAISVIIPAYNSRRTLLSAVQSVVDQGRRDLELIVVDDGSVDGTAEALQGMSRLPVKVFRQENRGPAAARNLGIVEARGEWIAFLDADDVWLPGKLDAQMSALARNRLYGFCYTDSIIRAPDGSETTARPRRGGRLIFEDLLLGTQFGTGAVIVSRDSFDRVGLFDTELRTGEDWDMWLRLAGSGAGCHVSESFLVYEISNNADKYTVDLLERCTLRVLERLFSRQWNTTTSIRPTAIKGWLYAWHYAVLAKSYFARRRYRDALRLSASSVRSHPAGFRFLARSWDVAGRWPDIHCSIAEGGSP